jgi:hypothetical protein
MRLLFCLFTLVFLASPALGQGKCGPDCTCKDGACPCSGPNDCQLYLTAQCPGGVCVRPAQAVKAGVSPIQPLPVVSGQSCQPANVSQSSCDSDRGRPRTIRNLVRRVLRR